MARREWPTVFVLLLLSLLLGACATHLPPAAMPAPGASRPSSAQLLEAYGRVPLHFEEGRGQAGDAVRYLARIPGGVIAITAEGLALDVEGAQVRIGFAGAQAGTELRALDPLAGRVNSYLGRDAAAWRTGVPTYRRVRYEALYPGIDVVVYGNQRHLEYDVVLAPEADPGRIRLRIDGADAVELDGAGDLRIRRGARTIVQHAPVAYQERDGVREPVESRYVLRGRELAFALGPYDRTRALIIDPVVEFATRIGIGVGAGIAVDASGHAYITGVSFGGTGYPVVNGTPHAVTGAADIFVTKLTPAGDALVFSTFVGGTGPDHANAIALDSAGNAWVAGRTGPNSASTDFPTTSGAFVPAIIGHGSEGSAGLAFKLSATGALLYSTYLQGTAHHFGFGPSGSCLQGSADGVAVDAAGNAYVVGYTTTTNLPTTPGAYQTTAAPDEGPGDDCRQQAGFVVKFDSTNAVGYSTYLDAVGDDRATAVAADAAGNAYVTGGGEAAPFPITTNLAAGGTWDGWLVKLDPVSMPIWATALGPVAGAIALATDGTILVAGTLSGADTDTLTTVNAFQPSRAGGNDGFAARLNAAGTASLWSTYIGGASSDVIGGIAAAADGSAWIVGTSASSDFPTQDPLKPKTAGSDLEIVTLTLSPTGTLVFGTYLGEGQGAGVAIDVAGAVYLTGDAAASFDTTPGAFKTTPSAGGDDVFVLKFAAPGSGGTQDVIWTSPVKVAVSGNTITKNAGCNGCADAGAISQQTIASGNGSVAFNVSAGASLTAGLSTGNPGTSGSEIKFGLRFFPGYVEVRESGVWKASWPIAAGDLHKVAADGGVVKYFLNGTLKYTSAVAPTYPLLVDAALFAVGSAVQNAVIAGAGGGGGTPPPDAPPTPVTITAPANGATVSGTVMVSATASDDVGVTGVQFKVDGVNIGPVDTTAPYTIAWDSTTVAPGTHTLTAVATDTVGNATTSTPVTVTVVNDTPPGGNVAWTSAVNVAVSGNTITKNAGCSGCWDAGAVSQQTFASGNVAVSFTVSAGAALTAGLSSGNAGTGANEIKFGLRFFPGYVEVRESGVWKESWPIAAGATHTVAVEGGVVKYFLNGTLKYTSAVPPAYPLLADATIETVGGAVQNAVLTTAP